MKTTFKYDHYYKYDEIDSNLKHFVMTYPDLIDLEVNCVTKEGRNQYVAILTNKKTGSMLEKPGWYLDGNIHAGEVTSSMCAMHTIDYLLTNYEDDKEVKKILDEMTVYVIPRVTPDGAETYLSSPYTLRSVNRVHKDEKGGIKEEDIDKDGVIRMMRIKTPYGAWKKAKDDPAIMELRSPSDSEGDFYDIYPEGMLENFDGDENLKTRKEAWGLDFNRNFPYGWFPEPRQDGAGDYPLSNVETKAIVDFVLAHPNIGGAAIGHTSGGIILYPPGTRASEKAPADDIKILKAIAEMGEEELGYKPFSPRSYAYCSDTTPFPEESSWVHGVDILYHEATYLSDLADLAVARHHSTTLDAARCALEACAGRLIIGHYSSRSKEISLYEAECRTIFPSTFAASDLDTFDVSLNKVEL